MKTLFRTLEPMGLHISRNHFYEPIPDTRRLKPELWSKTTEPAGIDLRRSQQWSLVEEVTARYGRECAFPQAAPAAPHEYYLENDFFQTFDAEIYHCFIRQFKPKQIVEIGAGYSTMIAARAALMNQAEASGTEVTCVEPYPNKTLQEGFPGLTRLLLKDVQDVDVSIFRDLDANDILFIDSSHVVKVGGDVVYEYLRILPILRPGVIVHIHDIFIPEDYPREWVVGEHKFWSEQYLLEAFLSFNSSFEILWASNYMSQHEKDRLEQLFPAWKGSYSRLPKERKSGALSRDGQNVRPTSFWIRRIL
jgi:hypothetical protein